jgi:hypothetical protein
MLLNLFFYSTIIASTGTARNASMQCIGRFKFELPEKFVVSLRTQKIFLTKVRDNLSSIVNKSAPESPVMQVLRYGINPKSPLIKEIQIPKVGPGAWFGLGSSDSYEKRLVAIKGDLDSGLRMELLSGKGREAAAEKALQMVSSEYRNNDRSGFCLEVGSIVGEPSRNEQVSFLIESLEVENKISIFFESQTISEKNHDNPLKDLKLMRFAQKDLTLISDRKEILGDRKGQTVQYSFKNEVNEKIFVSQFFFAGKPKNATHPKISIKLSGPLHKKEELESIWKKWMGSFH